MLKIEGITFMNIQEAVQWLLDNNALPFQSSANYIANAEIGMGTIVNPSPAKVRIGSLIFFADSKVSTVTGLTENGFIVSDQYNSLVDDVAYVTNVSINGSGHLITTLSDGQTIDAGLIKQINSLTIDALQQLVVTYNDGTSTVIGSFGDFSNVDFQAKTIEALNPNFSTSLGIYITGCTVTDYYSKVIISDNILYLIFNFKFKNTSSAPVTLYTLGVTYVNIPAKYALKVYDLNGHTAHDNDGSYCLITLFKGYICDDLNGTNRTDLEFKITNTTAVDQFVVYQESSGITLNVNEEKFVTGRVMLTLY